MAAQKTFSKDRRRSNGFSKSTADLFSSSTSEQPHISTSCYCCAAAMLNLRRIFSLLRRPCRRRSKSPLIIRRFPAPQSPKSSPPSSIRIATFNAAMFSISPAAPNPEIAGKTLINDPPKSILKRQQTNRNSKRRVSINLSTPGSVDKLLHKGKAPILLEVLKSVDADVFSLQNVKADEEKGMNPLADLAGGLGMKYAFAESWAPDFGNAILSKWPIKQSCVQKICNDDDFRNVLKVTIEVPGAGEVDLHCTHLDHLDEDWRLKQIGAILGSSEQQPHILAAGLNALDETDYSAERWNDIVKYHEENGKPRPRADVMRLLKEKQYMDAKDFAGDQTEAVVVVAKGQGVQGTCKYGTRVDYILASPGSPYKFLPGSYAVMSSKGTGEDRLGTGEDRLGTGEDRLGTGWNRTGEDRLGTGPEVLIPGLVGMSSSSSAPNEEAKCRGYYAFDMASLSLHLPQKRGLSRYFSGESKSFKSIADVGSIHDLKKNEISEAKRRKYMNTKEETRITSTTCIALGIKL
ncbi:hypothetical protein KSP39_PZI002742 [Platanthera zijinensis]|uniref:Endonuclease/exonuclease/phosphatase domain-containing protein n=1 Tax=Platanthera zijinensis TaxID=2320716 RepID=A0AAP0BZ00_9ASPA